MAIQERDGRPKGKILWEITGGRIIPDGFSAKTLEFLCALKKRNLLDTTDSDKEKLIKAYLGHPDIPSRELKIMTGAKSFRKVKRLIKSGLKEAWRRLPDEEQKKFPPREVIQLRTPSPQS